MIDLHINLSSMPSGRRYEDTYGMYMETFKAVAERPPLQRCFVNSPPVCWIPLLEYLGAVVIGYQFYFYHDKDILTMVNKISAGICKNRTAVEVLCGFRPELVDALWKIDMQWTCNFLNPEQEDKFIVTGNGGFHRKEVLVFLDLVKGYMKEKENCLILPCAADKPYPAKLHSEILNFLPCDYEIVIATGVMGLIPQRLWDVCPAYDSGIPNEWRLYTIAKEFFVRNKYSKIVCYVDYYSTALKEAFNSINLKAVFVNKVKFYSDYLDLLDNERLQRLKEVL